MDKYAAAADIHGIIRAVDFMGNIYESGKFGN